MPFKNIIHEPCTINKLESKRVELTFRQWTIAVDVIADDRVRVVLFRFTEQTANYDQQKQRNGRDDGDDHVQGVRGDAGIVCDEIGEESKSQHTVDL